MGCNQSMTESQAVSLCKDRNHFIKEAVSSRDTLAAAHSAYSICLKNTGAALYDFISGEFPHLSFVRNDSFSTQHNAYSSSPIELPPPPPPPPLPVPYFQKEKVGTTIMEDNKLELEDRNNEKSAKIRSNTSDTGSSSEGESYYSCDQGDQAPPPQPVLPVEFHMPAVGKLRLKKGGVKMGRRLTKPVSLMQIFADLDRHFLKASVSARELSQMLGYTGLHHHSSSVDNLGHIDHFKRVMRVITCNFPFEGMSNVDDHKDGFYTQGKNTHFRVLDNMLAREKLLYNEVKKQGSRPESLEKLKADAKHLHKKDTVDMQSFESAVAEINRLRDDQLYPKLVKLVERMATHWKSMHYRHETQCKIVYAMKSLDKSEVVGETTNYHNSPTILLCGALHNWHMQFCRLILCEKQYIRALHNWIKLTRIPIESTSPNIQNPPIYALLTAWINDLDKLPDEVVDSAIFNFAVTVNTILHNHDEEIKMREKCEETRKEIEQKSRQYREWCKKRGVTEEMNRDNPLKIAKEQRESVVVSLRRQLEKDEEECRKICRHVREKTLDSLKNRLPELFHAITEISLAYSVMYSSLISLGKKPYAN